MAASEATVFGLRHGTRGVFRLKLPGLDPAKYWFDLQAPISAKDRERIKTAGLLFTGDEDTNGVRVDIWNDFIAKADAQVVGFCYPQFKLDDDVAEGEPRTIVGQYEYARNERRNHEVYETLGEAELLFIMAAMDDLAGRTKLPQSQELWDRLGNEHGPLLTPIDARGS